MFAKLFSTRRGQLLLRKDQNEDADGYVSPVLFIEGHVESPFGFGEAIASQTWTFPGTDAGEAARDKTFDDFDQSRADEFAKNGKL
jgi:hypothetical protein